MWEHSPQRTVKVEGCSISYRRFGTAIPNRTALALVHGSHAHGGWWAGVVPHLLRDFDLIVPDLSGNGDSDWREEYRYQTWVSEIAEIAAHERIEQLTVVGHSSGGRIGIFLAADMSTLVDHVVLLDTPLPRPVDLSNPTPLGPPPGARPSTFETFEAALERFRLRPPQPVPDADLLAFVAERCVRRVGDRWEWKSDPRTRQRVTDVALYVALGQVRPQVDLIIGAQSTVARPDTVDYVRERTGNDARLVIIDQAHHHVPLDSPKACADTIRSLLTAPS